MNLLIADTFNDSLARLTGDEQKAVKTTAFDLQINPANPGMSFHRLDRARDKNFWSVRVNDDLRIIVHRSDVSLLLCFVGHHEPAYAWAERRKLETHPKTGAAQLVEIRETVKEIVVPVYIEEKITRPRNTRTAKAALFADVAVERLLEFGVPPEWIDDVRKATEDTLLALADHLPAEAAEALLELATGGNPRVIQPALPLSDPFEHPDARRRFRVMRNQEELAAALDAPWEKWTIFLHPDQKELVEREYSGPARVSGSAGTGKTIVALHRTVFLARKHPDARILLTTFSDPLANALRKKLQRLLGSEPRLGERIDVVSLEGLALRLYKSIKGKATIVTRKDLREMVRESSRAAGEHGFTQPFLLAEWDHVVDAWRLETWESYRDVPRLGRKTRLPEPKRKLLWRIFEGVLAGLKSRHLMTNAELFTTLAEALAKKTRPIFDFAVIDEAQDLTISQVRFFAALGGSRPDALLFTGDVGQRIFQQPFSWKNLGIDIRGRSRTLRVNYRTSHQIRIQADRLLDGELVDADGNKEKRDDTVSVFNGPSPLISCFGDEGEEVEAVTAWLKKRVEEGTLPHEFGVFVRSPAQIERASNAVKKAGLTANVLDDRVEMVPGRVSISTMHLAKGLEFRAVVVMGCDDEVIPLQERIENVGEDGDLQEVYDTERQLLYVACTRARDQLLVTGVEPTSEFLDDLKSPQASS